MEVRRGSSETVCPGSDPQLTSKTSVASMRRCLDQCQVSVGRPLLAALRNAAQNNKRTAWTEALSSWGRQAVKGREKTQSWSSRTRTEPRVVLLRRRHQGGRSRGASAVRAEPLRPVLRTRRPHPLLTSSACVCERERDPVGPLHSDSISTVRAAGPSLLDQHLQGFRTSGPSFSVLKPSNVPSIRHFSLLQIPFVHIERQVFQPWSHSLAST